MTKIDYEKFAAKFILERIQFFEKDMRLCLRDYHWELKDKITHAYFPALMLCCANLEFMGSLYGGSNKQNKKDRDKVNEFVQEFMDTTIYSKDVIYVLWEGFRHKLAHLAHPEYVYIHKEKRITWAVDEKEIIKHKGHNYQHMKIRKADGKIGKKILKPYDVQYSHIISISLPVFKSDIQCAMKAYLKKMKNDETMLPNFEKIMNEIFPK